MSVIVRMEMPMNCPCELSAEVFDPSGNYGGHQPCFAWYGIPARSKEFDRCVVRSERPAWCPIIGELPEQHGDLINREYAIASACSGLTMTLRTAEGEEKWIRVKEVRESIKSAPIIVPAERSET